MQYLINHEDWVQISAAGKSVTVRLDEQDDGARGHCDARVIASKTKPDNTEEIFTQAKTVHKPDGNSGGLFLDPRGEDFSFWARTKSDGDVVTLIAEEDGIGFHKRLDVAVQDQHTDIVDVYVCEKIADVTLAAPTIPDTRTVTLVTGHGAVNGNVLCIKNGKNWYQGRVLDVNGNTITVNQPINNIYPVETTAMLSSSNLAVDGSAARRIFAVYPPANAKWDITRMMLVIRDDAAMDDGKFGGITGGLVNGVMFRIKKSATHWNNLFNARNNGEFALRAFDAQYTDPTQGPSGQYGLRVRRSFSGFDKNGVVVRLDGSDPNSMIEIIVQDNLASLAFFSVVVQGHVVED